MFEISMPISMLSDKGRQLEVRRSSGAKQRWEEKGEEERPLDDAAANGGDVKTKKAVCSSVGCVAALSDAVMHGHGAYRRAAKQ